MISFITGEIATEPEPPQPTCEYIVVDYDTITNNNSPIEVAFNGSEHNNGFGFMQALYMSDSNGAYVPRSDILYPNMQLDIVAKDGRNVYLEYAMFYVEGADNVKVSVLDGSTDLQVIVSG